MKKENKKKIQDALQTDFDKSVEAQEEMKEVLKKKKDNREKVRAFVATNYRPIAKLVKDIATENATTMLDQFRTVSNENEQNGIDRVTKSYIRVEIITRGSANGRLLAYLHFEGKQYEGTIEIIKNVANLTSQPDTLVATMPAENLSTDKIEDEITNFIAEYYTYKSK